MYRLAPSGIRRRLRHVRFVALFMLTLAATGCLPSYDPEVLLTRVPPTPTVAAGELLPFSVLATGSRLGFPEEGWPGEKWGESVFLATNPQEYDALWAQLPEPEMSPPATPGTPAVPQPTKPPAVDFRRQAVIAVFYAEPNCERAIAVTHVLKQESSLLVYAEAQLILPLPACPAVEHMLFQLVAIPWDDTPAAQVDVGLVLYPVEPEE